MWLAYKAILPSLVAGNPIIMKQASQVPQTGEAIEQGLHAA